MANVPSVENRLSDLQQILALFSLVNSALGCGNDLCLPSGTEALAHARLSTLADEGGGHLRAILKALPAAGGLFVDAPDVEVTL